MNNNQHQINALQIISVQHELSLAIGNKIGLHDMLQHFLQVCIQRLGLISAHAFIYTDSYGWPETRIVDNKVDSDPAHFISIPSHQNGLDWSSDLLSQTSCDENLFHYCHKEFDNTHFYSFAIPGHGTLILQPRQHLEPTILNALKPIFDRLANSCHASILHESLLREMSAREEAEKSLQHMAFHNSVTDLPNRHWLARQLDSEQFQVNMEREQCALLCIEVDNFRKLTSIMGHAIGDNIQKCFAAILRSSTRKSDHVSQLNADIFMVIIGHAGQHDSAIHDAVENVLNKIRTQISEPVMIGAKAITLSITAGYEVFRSLDCESGQIINHAEIAKSESHSVSSDTAVLYSNSMQEQVENRVRMESDLKLASRNDELSLWWQPQYNASHELIGAEALLRWHSSEWGSVSPGVFIPLAEESDLIEKIGDWVLETACRQLSEISALGLPNSFKKLSINVNARQLIHSNFVENVIRLIKEYHIPKGLLGIELTESTLVQSFDQTVLQIDRLRMAGVDCSIDDFGTGYSSLSYLKKLPIRTIKIDQSFVRNIHLSKGDQAIANTLVYLGKNLHKDIIAEGVETEEELQCLITMGCNQFQGYFFDKPMPLETLVERWHPKEAPAQKFA